MAGFKKTMPLITDLRNPAMRPRHWAQLQEAVGATFDPASQGFTLDSVMNLHLDLHVDYISELSAGATKELAIEQSISVWNSSTHSLIRRLIMLCHAFCHGRSTTWLQCD